MISVHLDDRVNAQVRSDSENPERTQHKSLQQPNFTSVYMSQFSYFLLGIQSKNGFYIKYKCNTVCVLNNPVN